MAATSTALTPSSSSPPSVILQLFTRLLTRTNAKKLAGLYFLLLVIKYRSCAYGVRPRPDIPGPRAIPLLGNLWLILMRPRENTYQNITLSHEKYGKVYSITVPGAGRIVNVNDPESIDHVLRVNFHAYVKGEFLKNALYPIVGEGIFGADGEHWRWQRKLASHIFNVNAFREYTGKVFVQEANIVLDYFSTLTPTTSKDPSPVIDLQDIFYKFTLDSFGEVAFGQSFGCLANPTGEVPFASAFDRLGHSLPDRITSPIWKIKDWWTGNDKVVERDVQTVYRFADGVIQKRREEMLMGVKREGEGPKDLLQLFMEATDGKGEQLSDTYLREAMLNFLIAGRDTTAQCLSWMFYLLHRTESSKEILERLVQETDSVLQGNAPTYESTRRQKYAEACMNETLRLYPSVPTNIKVCVQDDVLPCGAKVYKGEKLGWSTWTMGRSTDIWGPDAAVFRPERWLTGEKPSNSKFVSFHLGPRTCLGQQFATIEAITIMSMLLQKFTFELVDPVQEPAYLPSLTLPMAKGLPVRIRHRAD